MSLVTSLSAVAGASVMDGFEGDVSVITDDSEINDSSVYTSTVDTSFVDASWLVEIPVVIGTSVTVIVAKGFTADALQRKPLKFNASLAKKLTVVPRSVVTMKFGPSRPQNLLKGHP